jgi:hypothetical protein
LAASSNSRELQIILSLSAENQLFDQGTNDMAKGDVSFLDALGAGRRHVEKKIDLGA